MDENQPVISWHVMDRYLCYMQMQTYDLDTINELQDAVSKLRYVTSRIDTDRMKSSTISEEVKEEIASKTQKQKDEILRYCNYMELVLNDQKNEIYKSIPKLPLDVHNDECMTSLLGNEK